MIPRGDSHRLHGNPTELLKRIRVSATLAVLDQLQYFYDLRSRRILFDEQGGIVMEGIHAGEVEEFHKLMELTKVWLQPSVRVNFKGVKSGQSKQRRRSNGKRR